MLVMINNISIGVEGDGFEGDGEKLARVCLSPLFPTARLITKSPVSTFLSKPPSHISILLQSKYKMEGRYIFRYDTLSANVVKSFPKLAKSESGQIVSENVKLT